MQAHPFRELAPDQIPGNPFHLIGSDWMLITAGPPEAWNTMTASWGGLGILWNKPVSFCFVRPGRHTRGFIDRSGLYTLSFFAPEHHRALEYCGAHSGREVDKARETGLTPVGGEGMTWFAEARLVLQCRKLYIHDLDPAHFLEPGIEGNYPKRDYHRQYIGEIVKVLGK